MQQFKLGYTAPPQLFHFGGIPMNFRYPKLSFVRDLRNPGIIEMIATDCNLIDTTDYDDYSVPST
ncbi:hypothetical protein QJS04_geneDACA023970 [Acorus gramineus]|uniref:Uncharacterized protein n=1 Tax=Acorus gramineus TaxID=55184 RepID=A0AAV9A094_ACOGR|nr:hypothetical protein QJS04_geneDACA023970 [Acorus gramineus]